MTDQTDGHTRRQVLTALGAAGLLGASSTASADEIGIGGGPMSDELSHLNVRVYSGPEDELPEPGIEGRYFHVEEDGSLWKDGDILEDTGDSWEKINAGFGSVSAEQHNNVRYVDAARGAGEVQNVFDDVSKPALINLYSSAGDVTWERRIDIPNNVRLEQWGDFTISLSSESDLTPVAIRGGDFFTLITNEDYAGTGEGVGVVGLDIDFNGTDNDQNKAPILLHDVENARVEDTRAENAPGTTPGRQYDILYSDCTDSRIDGSVGVTAGYECIGVRGDCDEVLVSDSEGWDGGSHSMQSALMSGNGVDDGGQPTNIKWRDCRGDGNLTIHGHEDEAAGGGHVVENCSLRTDIIGNLKDVHVRSARDLVRIESTPSDTHVRRVTVDGGHENDGSRMVYVVGSQGGACEVDNLVVRHLENNDSLNAPVEVRNDLASVRRLVIDGVTNHSDDDMGALLATEDSTVEHAVIRDFSGSTNYISRATNGATVTHLDIKESDFSDLGWGWPPYRGGGHQTVAIDGVGEEEGTTGEPTDDWPRGVTVETDDGVYKRLESGDWHAL